MSALCSHVGVAVLLRIFFFVIYADVRKASEPKHKHSTALLQHASSIENVAVKPHVKATEN